VFDRLRFRSMAWLYQALFFKFSFHFRLSFSWILDVVTLIEVNLPPFSFVVKLLEFPLREPNPCSIPPISLPRHPDEAGSCLELRNDRVRVLGAVGFARNIMKLMEFKVRVKYHLKPAFCKHLARIMSPIPTPKTTTTMKVVLDRPAILDLLLL